MRGDKKLIRQISNALGKKCPECGQRIEYSLNTVMVYRFQGRVALGSPGVQLRRKCGCGVSTSTHGQ